MAFSPAPTRVRLASFGFSWRAQTASERLRLAKVMREPRTRMARSPRQNSSHYSACFGDPARGTGVAWTLWDGPVLRGRRRDAGSAEGLIKKSFVTYRQSSESPDSGSRDGKQTISPGFCSAERRLEPRGVSTVASV